MAESFVQVNLSFLKNKRFNSTEKLILMMLKSYAWTDNTCFPSADRLAKDLNCSNATVRNAIRKFKSVGILKAQKRFDEYGRSKSNLYIIDIEKAEAEPKEKVPPKEKVEQKPEDGKEEKSWEELLLEKQKRELAEILSHNSSDDVLDPFKKKPYYQRRRL